MKIYLITSGTHEDYTIRGAYFSFVDAMKKIPMTYKIVGAYLYDKNRTYKYESPQYRGDPYYIEEWIMEGNPPRQKDLSRGGRCRCGVIEWLRQRMRHGVWRYQYMLDISRSHNYLGLEGSHEHKFEFEIPEDCKPENAVSITGDVADETDWLFY